MKSVFWTLGLHSRFPNNNYGIGLQKEISQDPNFNQELEQCEVTFKKHTSQASDSFQSCLGLGLGEKQPAVMGDFFQKLQHVPSRLFV